MIKRIIKKNKFLFKILVKFKTKLDILLRLKDVVMMMLLFNIIPSYTYKFSTRKSLPPKKNRFSKPQKTEPYKLIKNKSNMKKLGEINLVSLGVSFDINNIKNLKSETFLTPGWEPLKVDEEGNIYHYRPGWDYDKLNSRPNFKSLTQDYKKDFKRKLKNFKDKDITYVIGRKESLSKYLKKGYKFLSVENYNINEDGCYYPLSRYCATKSYQNLFNKKNFKRIALLENIYKPPLQPPYWTPSGSLLPVLFALSKYAKKINVYGWDFYLTSSPENMNYWELFFNLYKYKIDVFRSKNHFESALLNFYYGYQLSKLPNINIHGYLGKLDKHEKLIKRIERVLFN